MATSSKALIHQHALKKDCGSQIQALQSAEVSMQLSNCGQSQWNNFHMDLKFEDGRALILPRETAIHQIVVIIM